MFLLNNDTKQNKKDIDKYLSALQYDSTYWAIADFFNTFKTNERILLPDEQNRCESVRILSVEKTE